MDKILKNILKKIEDQGYEAYIVGGFVRDNLIKRQSYDVDICTNAVPKELGLIFKNNSCNNYGSLNFKIKKYNIDITTYRKEGVYKDKRHPSEVQYVSNLLEDIKRRDFTINAICLDKNDTIIDLTNGIEDINNKIIRTIKDPTKSFKEDPLRILRAIRFATTLDFNIETKTYNAIKNNYELVYFISEKRIKDEISKILSSKNFQKGLDILNKTKICNVIGLKYDKIVYTSDLLGMWAQVKFKNKCFSKAEKDNIASIKTILNVGRVTNIEMFLHGLYLSRVAGEILGIDAKVINKKYKGMPIKSMKDIKFNGKNIIDTLKIKPSKKVNEIMINIRNEILNSNLRNNYIAIKKYVLEKWQNG
ncbi:MAG: hypothetical protein GX951_04770 [Mollicutes bacterium]|nr:hypothetical protein [Mollicutes bacterium]